jgi:hypothetical protein
MQKSLILAGAIALAPAAAHAQQISIIDLLFNDGGLFLNVQFTATGFADPSTVCGTGGLPGNRVHCLHSLRRLGHCHCDVFPTGRWE